jgi:protein-L-isoaspartate O-methyltransferase
LLALLNRSRMLRGIGLSRQWEKLTQFTGDPYLQSMMGHGLRASSNSELVDKLLQRGFLVLPEEWGPERLKNIKAVDRAQFISKVEPPNDAYANVPHRIFGNHFMSTPQLHAQIISLLAPKLGPGKIACEIGCGTGYIPAVMASLGCSKVFGIEANIECLDTAVNKLSYNSNIVVSREVEAVSGSTLDALYISPYFASKDRLMEFIEPIKFANESILVAAYKDECSQSPIPDQQLVIMTRQSNEWVNSVPLFRVLGEGIS